MRLPSRACALLLIVTLPAVTAVCFHRLVAAPSSLVVDGRRPSVDHAARGQVRGVGNDLTTVFLPRFSYAVGAWNATGKRPLWDASGFGGRPLVGNPQGGQFYPPAWLAQASGHPASLGWLTVAHLLWGGVGVFVLTRALGFRTPASIVAGGCFEASPYLIAHTFEGHYPHVWSACWYPWAFWALLLASRKKAVGVWLLPGVLALTFLTGHPQEWYYLVLALTAWVAADAVRAFGGGGRRDGIGRVAVWGGVVALSLAACAVELGPELAAWPYLLKKSVIPLGQVNRYQLHLVNLFQLLSPFALGRPESYRGHDNYWETVLSIGLAPLVLAAVGVARHPDRAMARRWLMLVVAAVVFASGRKLGLYAVAYGVLPGMERFRVPSRSLFLASLGAAVLAGAGVDALLRRSFRGNEWPALRGRLRYGLLGVGAVVLVGLAVVTAVRGADARSREALAVVEIAHSPYFWASLIGMVGVVSAVGPRVRGPSSAAWGLGGVALAELALYAQSLLVCTPVSLLAGSGDGVGAWEAAGERVASVGAAFPDLRAAALGVEKANVNDGFQIQHAADLYERLYPFLDPSRRRFASRGRPMDEAVARHRAALAQTVLDVMSVRYLVSDRDDRPPVGPGRLTRGASAPGGPTVWVNPGALPRAYVVPRGVAAGHDAATIVARLAEVDPRETVLIDDDPLPAGARQPFTPAELSAADPDAVTVRVETGAPGLLVVGNTWMPGWTATVDRQPAPVLRGNHWSQVVPIATAGRHEVVLTYRPPGYAVGQAASAVALLAWAAAGVVVLARAWRPFPVRWPTLGAVYVPDPAEIWRLCRARHIA